MSAKFDSIIMIGFGGPEKSEDIMPFLRNVVRGRNIPDERLKIVAHHYELLGGKSPYNELTFQQAKGLGRVLSANGVELPIYVGMRNWRPLLPDVVKRMSEEGRKSALGLIMAGYQSFSSWQQYQENYESALTESGVEIAIEYTRPFFDHPLFIEAVADRVEERLSALDTHARAASKLLFTAHSIPTPMADKSPYVEQLTTACRLVAQRVGHEGWSLVYQSRSGRPQDPWLVPDVCDVISDLAQQGVTDIVVHPIGFICDHVEVLFDIGVEAKETAENAGVNLHITKSVNDDEKFLMALADIISTHIDDDKSQGK